MTPAEEPLPPLLRRLPALQGLIAWERFGRFPTPVQRIALPDATQAWVKRDDMTAVPYGGNKVRKLELILAEAQRRGAGRIITAGAFGSHHCLATTIFAARLGLPVTCIMFPQRVTDHVRDVIAGIAAAGADLRVIPRMEAVPLALAAARVAYRRERPCIVAPGGSDALGTLGYANAGLELAEQVAGGAAPQPAEIYVAAGTLGTAAGLAIGCALADMPATVVAVRITSRLLTNDRNLRRLVRAACSRIRRCGAEPPAERDVLARVRIDHRWIGDGYGRETAAGAEATRLLGEAGLGLGPTYTAKAAAAFLDAERAGGAAPRIFWHTLSRTSPTAPPGTLGRLPPGFARRLRL
jgi:1-aminocyclopropane-1-carboxylate deaminase/D-cysteine desulfhydrase-like pyridoxal-dependent ACC family enzyme